MVILEQWAINSETGEKVLLKTIRRERQTADLMINSGGGWIERKAAKESRVSEGPKVSRTENKKEVVETPSAEEKTMDNADAFTGVADLTLDKAKKFISLCSDVEKLNFIIANDGRKTVENAAKARLKKVK